MRKALRAGLSGVVFSAAVVGCGGSFLSALATDGGTDATPEPHDASVKDTGVRRDTGSTRDTGARPLDGAVAPDADPFDAHSPLDTGAAPDSSSAPDAADDTSAKHDAETDAAHAHDAGPPSPCPATVPTAGSACMKSGLACEYGSDPDVACDTVMTCTAGAWVETGTPEAMGCSTTNGIACPATLAQVPVGSTCTTDVSCYYPDARCECASHLPEINLIWSCDIPSGATMCPVPRPRLGSSCTMANEECDYGACEGGFNLACTGGVWVETQTICPG